MKRLIILLLLSLFIFSCSKNPSQTDQPRKIDNVFYDKAYKFRDTLVIYDSAYYYFNKAKEVFLKQNDSLYAGKCLVNMAIISTDKGDYFGGQELSLSAIPYFHPERKGDSILIRSNFNNLGLAYFNLKNYEKAIEFYYKSLSFVKDSTSLPSIKIKNNIANAYREKGNYKKALELYQKLLAQKVDDKDQYARIITINAITKWLQNPKYNAAPELLKALHLREKENNTLSLHSSYAHLTSYYTKKRPDSALFYARKMYSTAKEINSPDDLSQALEKLIKLSPSEATKYFEIYQPLRDSLETARNRDKNQFAPIRYEIEKHRADNLKLQKDNTEKNYQLFFLAIGSIVLIGAGIFWYRKRKQRLEMETQNAISESELKTSKKVHDVVANGLYRVMAKVEHEEDIDKEHLLDEIEELYEKSRDISYEKPITSAIDFHQKIAELLKSFNSANTKVSVIGNNQELWRKADRKAKDEVWHILQELMVNMSKHSQATQVTLRFENAQENIYVLYEDNGIGMAQDKEFNNGLRNTETRIENLNGQLTFETKLEKGLKIRLQFPVS